jgi:hypothetical protein
MLLASVKEALVSSRTFTLEFSNSLTTFDTTYLLLPNSIVKAIHGGTTTFTGLSYPTFYDHLSRALGVYRRRRNLRMMSNLPVIALPYFDKPLHKITLNFEQVGLRPF